MSHHFLNRLSALRRDLCGATVAEYIVLIGLVALGAVAAFKFFGSSILGASGAQGKTVTCVAVSESGDCAGPSGNLPPPPSGGANPGASPSPGGGDNPGGGANPGSGGPVAGNDDPPGGSMCFAAGTLIATPSGLTPIEEIRTGDTVLSMRVEAGEVVEEPVLETFRTLDREVLDVYVLGQSPPIEVTPGHLFFTRDRGWVHARDLAATELLAGPQADTLDVEGLVTREEHETVYNFEVAETHTYFVGAAMVLVHNPDGTVSPVPEDGPPPGAPFSVTAPSAGHNLENFPSDINTQARKGYGFSLLPAAKMQGDTDTINTYLKGGAAGAATGVTHTQDRDRTIFTMPDGTKYSTHGAKARNSNEVFSGTRSGQLFPVASPGVATGSGAVAVAQQYEAQTGKTLKDPQKYGLMRAENPKLKPYNQTKGPIRDAIVAEFNNKMSAGDSDWSGNSSASSGSGGSTGSSSKGSSSKGSGSKGNSSRGAGAGSKDGCG